MENHTIYWIWLQTLFGIGTRRVERIMDYFGDPRELYDGVAQRGAAAAMLTEEELSASEKCMQFARAIEARTMSKGCHILTPDHHEYPLLLKALPDRPAALYCKGDLSCLRDNLAVAVVGTRKHTPYGRDAAALLAGGLAEGGAVVVSGLAHGIDTDAHRAALAAGGKTVGVLGCGLDIDYPAGSGPLKTAMSQNGAVLTEYPLGTHPLQSHFPLRNRIISGMSRGTLVVEADLRSGSLITARLAREQGRDVFAVPGPINQQGGQGANQLLKEGAHLVDCVEDIFEAYPWHMRNPPAHVGVLVAETGASPGQPIPVNPRDVPPHSSSRRTAQVPPAPQAPQTLPPAASESAHRVYAAIGGEPVSVDDIAEGTALTTVEVLSALTELELLGTIQSYPGRRFGLL